jgi:hypothetical protein
MRIVLAAIAFIFLTGCAKVVKDFVDNAAPPTRPPVVGGAEDDGAFKLSPGSVRSVGTNISMKATITPTNRLMTGNNVSAVMSMHKSR